VRVDDPEIHGRKTSETAGRTQEDIVAADGPTAAAEPGGRVAFRQQALRKGNTGVTDADTKA
jgi:hypothetical protein